MFESSLGQPDEAKYESFIMELSEFNEETNNYISEVLTGHEYYLDYTGTEPALIRARDLAQAISAALIDKGISQHDREMFMLYRGNEVSDFTSENYEFAVSFLEKIKEIFEELQEGKYLDIKFTREELIG